VPAPPPLPPKPAPPRVINVVPRSLAGWSVESKVLPNGDVAYIITGGVIVTVSDPTPRISILDMEADRAIVWLKATASASFDNMQKPEGGVTREAEFYLSGNVEIRSQDPKQTHTLRGDEVYYDVTRNVAVAYQADLEFNYIPSANSRIRLPDPVHVKADELHQLSPNLFEMLKGYVYSSHLPSDPGLTVYVSRGTIEQKEVPERTFLGFGPQAVDPITGQPITETQRIFKGRNVFGQVWGVPFFYSPYLQGDVNDPLGPLQSININYSKMYGTAVYVTWDVYDLLGMRPAANTRWYLNTDFMNKRGPGLGTNYDYSGKNFFGLPESPYTGYFRLYGMYDKGFDLLGGGRGVEGHPLYRGRAFWQQNTELPDGFYFQGRFSALSDKNYLEEYFWNEYATAPNQETFLYLQQRQGIFAWQIWNEDRIRNWINETERLPEVDGYMLGQSFPMFGDALANRFTYNAHASAGYYRLETTHVTPPPVGVGEYATNTARFDFWQDLSLPFSLGDVRFVPYATMDLTQYTQNLYGDSAGRFYGGGGLRGSVPFARLFPNVSSELLNLNGMYHKVVLSGNYYVAHSDVPLTTLPQLDRLNDDATDQSLMYIKPEEPIYIPGPQGQLLSNSLQYDPAYYMLRRVNLFSRPETLDTIDVLQADLRQRLQTKRGYPGAQHIVDWMTFDISAEYFPNPARDNFGSPFALVQYQYIWNIGDRTALVSDGWEDPMPNGARTYSIGGYFNRPDRTNFYLGYRYLEPVNSKLCTASVSYVFSPKYAAVASTAYDFGLKASVSNMFMLTRTGKDLQVSMGLTYNAILNNFGVVLMILPNAAAASGKSAAFGSQMLQR
jgi:hypothetical protein